MVRIDDPAADIPRARTLVARSGLTSYRVRLVSSGLGDMLSLAAFQSAIGDLLGLTFDGLTLPPSFSRPYYDALVTRLGLRAMATSDGGEPDLVLEGKQLTKSGLPLTDELAGVIRAAPAAQSLTISFPSPAAAGGIHDHQSLRAPFFSSAFRRRLREQSRTIFPLPRLARSLTMHVRLGDVAALRLGNHIVIPEFAKREGHPAGVVHRSALDRSPFVKKTLSVVDDCIAAARQIRQHFPGVRINLVSDGFDRTRQLLLAPALSKKLQNIGIDVADAAMNEYFASTETRIRQSNAFDRIVFGEATTDEWFDSVDLLLGSQVVVSTARGFAANMLTFFLDEPAGTRFYSPLGSGVYSDLATIGLEQRPFSTFADAVNDLKIDPPASLTHTS